MATTADLMMREQPESPFAKPVQEASDMSGM
jgi:hypothetical protein